MTQKRGEGDTGIAEEMLPLVERQAEPEVDFLRLADLFIAMNTAATADERLRIAGEAARVAGDNAVAKRMLERKLAELAASNTAA